MFRKNKKAVSTLVATVLLILITVAAVGIIWGAIMPMLNSAMEMGQACLNARLTIDTVSGYTCYKTSSRETQVMINRGAEEFNLAGIRVMISGGGRSKTLEIATDQNKNVTRMISDVNYTVTAITLFAASDLPSVNEDRTYIVNNSDISVGLTTVEEVKVAPIAKVGNTEKVCDISSRVTLTPCS